MPVPAIDIIIPVYNAYEDLCLCVDSVLRTVATVHRIILINDCSPDPRISDYFGQLDARDDPRITLLENERNLGFVQTTNRGMHLGTNDVILLNSDTIVTTGWLEKIGRCAESDPRIGTITPFSNNAEICSFPLICQDNALPVGQSAEDINRAIEASAVPVYPDIPTAVGFCMYIRRQLLDDVGFFDEQTFSLGYGEENDLCMRAAARGWRNVLCDDTFIQHTGNKSFDQKKQALANRNLQKLVARYPDYEKQVMAFISGDPLKPIRLLAESRLAVMAGHRAVLHIMHGASGGGTERHILSLMNNEQSRYRHYLLIAVEDVWYLKDSHGAEVMTLRFDHRADYPWSQLLREICRTFAIGFCHVHHLIHCREGLLQAIRELGLPYGFTVHDFFLACPTINLLGIAGSYCDAQRDPAICQVCLAAQPEFDHVNIADWRWLHQQFINDARFIITPSQWAADVFATYFPHPGYHVIAHGTQKQGEEKINSSLQLPADGHHHIGVLGAIGPVKGSRQLDQLVALTRQRKLPIRWIVIGYTDTQFEQYQSADRIINVHGGYEPSQLKSLLDHYQIRMTVFPSAGPETFCYTLTESWQAGRPALVPGIGALNERVQASGAGWIMTDWQDMGRVLDDLVSILSEEARGDFEARCSLAQRAPEQTIAAMAQANEALYDISISQTDTVGEPRLTNTHLYQALLLGMGFTQFVSTHRETGEEADQETGDNLQSQPRPGSGTSRFRYFVRGLMQKIS